jgi:hypothetical protein
MLNMLNKIRKRKSKFFLNREAREYPRKGICALYKKSQSIFIAILIILTISSCDNTFSIFQSIGQEKKQLGAELFKATTVRAMGSDGTNYYALMSKVVYRPIEGENWNILSIDGDSDYFAPGFASDGSTIFVAKADSNNNLEDIYSSSDNGTSWEAMDAKNSIGSGVSVDWLKYENKTLFVAVHGSAGYSLFYYDETSTSFKNAFVSTISSLSEPLVDIVWDGLSSLTATFWLISSSKVYSGAEGSIAEDTSASNNPSLSNGLVGIASDGAGRILVSRSDGIIYSYVSGSWTNFTVKSSTKLGPLILLNQPPTSNRILVAKGTSTLGYMEYDETVPAVYENGKDFVSTSQSIYNSTVRAKKVEGFWQPASDPNTIFILLATGTDGSYALYRNTYSGGTWGGWIAE